MAARLVGCVIVAIQFAATGAVAEPAMLVIERVEVRTVKDNGKPWDAGGGAPDLKVSVERTSAPKGEKHITAPQKDQFKAIFNCKALEVQAGEEIEILVLDEDFSSDDEVGKVSKKITTEMLKRKEVEISFDQVNKLVLKFEY